MIKFDKFQKAVFNEIQNGETNITISAVAGSGKTTTINESLNLIPKNCDSIYLAFNNTIVDEMKNRIENKKTNITTMHSFCWRQILRHTRGKAKLSKSKSYKHIEKTIKKYKIVEEKHAYYFYMISNMVDLIRHNLAKTPQDILFIADRFEFLLSEDDVLMISEVLILMNKDKTEYDFTDMIYRVINDNIKLPKFDFIFVDESQDLSKIQQEVVKRIKKSDGRMIAVGDPMQAIYGFAGADNNSYFNLKNLFEDTIELPLSYNYRCGYNIVKEAQNINENILPHKKATAGIVREGSVEQVKNGDFVLCRNVKPLVMMNLYLLSCNVKSFIKGYDIGIGLIQLVKKTHKTTCNEVLIEYQKEIYREVVKMKRKGVKNPKNTEKIDNMNQRLEIIKILSKDLKLSKDLINKISSIFKESGDGVVLSTIHKAKGTENNRVFILLPKLIPSQYATQVWQIEQEMNLMYVAITRAKNELIYINEDDFKKVKEKIEE